MGSLRAAAEDSGSLPRGDQTIDKSLKAGIKHPLNRAKLSPWTFRAGLEHSLRRPEALTLAKQSEGGNVEASEAHPGVEDRTPRASQPRS